jgi:hypothetical protein
MNSLGSGLNWGQDTEDTDNRVIHCDARRRSALVTRWRLGYVRIRRRHGRERVCVWGRSASDVCGVSLIKGNEL